MHRFLRFFASLALLVLVACGGGTTMTTPTTAPAATTTAAAATTAPTEMAAATMAPATAVPTEVATEAPTEAATQAPTEAATQAPTEAATAAMEMIAAPTMAMESTATMMDTATASAGAATGTLTVFAAASLTEAFGEIGEMFKAANPGTEITFNFAGSQQLAQQIDQGAPADVFASANNSQMKVVIDAGHIVTGTQTTFVRNRLVVIYPTDNPAGIMSLKDLAKSGIKLDLAAKEVPVGHYSLDFLDKASQDAEYGPTFKDAVIANVVSYEENVKAVLTKVSLGEADAGIVYSSDISQDAASRVGRLEIPDTLNTLASYPIAPVSESANAALAEKFIAYVLSPEAQAVLTKYNFIAP